MPELPEVETSLRGIEPHLVGRQIVDVVVRQPQLRWPIPGTLPALLRRRKLQGLSRRGKYLIFQFSHGHMLVHLGMSGSLRIVDKKSPAQKHDHVDWLFAGGAVLRLTDPRRFGAVLWTEDDLDAHKLLSHLGPEPLTEEFTADYLYARTRKRSLAVKTLIMDSKVVVGVGNIYANEALFLAGIRPTKAAKRVSRQACEALVGHIKGVLARAIAQGGTTLKDFISGDFREGGDGKPGYFKQELQVYGRAGEPCTHCGKALKEQRLSQRSTVYCTACQQ